jgi:hypothetical protein
MQILEGLKLAKKIYKNEIEIFIGTKTIFNPNIKHPKRGKIDLTSLTNTSVMFLVV